MPAGVACHGRLVAAPSALTARGGGGGGSRWWACAWQVVNLNNTALLSESAVDEHGEPKALGNENEARRSMERAQAEDAAMTSKQHYI